jgi:predicted signal transduction protein with EAL and GGDEF domain
MAARPAAAAVRGLRHGPGRSGVAVYDDARDGHGRYRPEAVDQATVAALTSPGCDVVQGYHLSRPLPPEQLWSWLQDRPPAT